MRKHLLKEDILGLHTSSGGWLVGSSSLQLLFSHCLPYARLACVSVVRSCWKGSRGSHPRGALSFFADNVVSVNSRK